MNNIKIAYIYIYTYIHTKIRNIVTYVIIVIGRGFLNPVFCEVTFPYISTPAPFFQIFKLFFNNVFVLKNCSHAEIIYSLIRFSK